MAGPKNPPINKHFRKKQESCSRRKPFRSIFSDSLSLFYESQKLKTEVSKNFKLGKNFSLGESIQEKKYKNIYSNSPPQLRDGIRIDSGSKFQKQIETYLTTVNSYPVKD